MEFYFKVKHQFNLTVLENASIAEPSTLLLFGICTPGISGHFPLMRLAGDKQARGHCGRKYRYQRKPDVPMSGR